MARELRDRLYGAINYYHVWSTDDAAEPVQSTMS